MRSAILLYLLVFVSGLFPLRGEAKPYEIKEIAQLSIHSAITPATYDYLQYHFSKLDPHALVIIKLNTPGGLITTTKDIITLIGEQNNPVVIWIAPEGASAASAGAIIAASAHFILMSPGTNMGAATPVGLNQEMEEGDAKSKVLNDLMAMVRSLSQIRGRPSEPFEKMIRSAESYTDSESLKLGIIDGIVSENKGVMELLAGKSFTLKGQPYTLAISDAAITKDYLPTTGQAILEVLANPGTAYFIFLIGVALLYIELQAPGGYIAGGIGLGFLILAAISFQILPLNWGALALIIIGMILLVLEIYITSYGILSVAGIASFLMGSLFLFHGEGGLISIDYPIILSTFAGVAFSMSLLIWYLIRENKLQHKPHDFFAPHDQVGHILTATPTLTDEFSYQVKVKGEIWNTKTEIKYAVGEKVQVTKVFPEQLKINIQKFPESKE